MNKSTKPEARVVQIMKKAGWHKVIVCGVNADGKIVLMHDDLTPIQIVGTLECCKMLTVRTSTDSFERLEPAK